MAKSNSVNLDITPNADGYSIAGGTTPRTLTLTAGNVTLSAGGSNTYTLPAATGTLVSRDSTDTLTNKTIDASTNTITNLGYGGYAQSTSNFSTSNTSATQITGVSVTVTSLGTSKRLKITLMAGTVYNSSANVAARVTLWRGTVGSGTQLQQGRGFQAGSSGTGSVTLIAVDNPTAGSVTYNAALHADSTGTATVEGSSTAPISLLVEFIN